MEQIRWTWNVKLYRNVRHGRIIYRRSIKLIDSWLQPPARSMDGTIDYLSLCNKTSCFIRGVCFILSIWMCKKKIHTNECVWQCMCVCVAVIGCVWDAESAESVCDVHQTELLTVGSSAKKSCCNSSGSVGENNPHQTLLFKLQMNLWYTAETLY